MLTTTEVALVLSGVPVGMLLTTIIACLMEGHGEQNIANNKIVVVELPEAAKTRVIVKRDEPRPEAPTHCPVPAEVRYQ
jgi:hypothetical protein